MKIRVISSREEIDSVRPNEKAVHLAFRASNVDFLNLLQKVPRLQMVQIPPSYKRTMSKALEGFREMQGVKLLEGDVWGHRKDLDEFFTVEDSTLDEIRTLVASGTNLDDITSQMQKKARINSDLVKYIAAESRITA